MWSEAIRLWNQTIKTSRCVCVAFTVVGKYIVYFSTSSWFQMRWQRSLYAQLLPRLLFLPLSSLFTVTPFTIKTDQPCMEIPAALALALFPLAALFCVWQHNYQKTGPRTIKSQWRLTTWAPNRNVSGDEMAFQNKKKRCSQTGSVLTFRQRWQGLGRDHKQQVKCNHLRESDVINMIQKLN